MKLEGNNVYYGDNVKLGKNVRIGFNSIIHDNVTIGDNTIIGNNCIIGEPIGRIYHSDDYQNPPLVIGAGSIIRSNTIIYAGSTFGSNLQTGHFVTIRENNIVGHHCSFGMFSNILTDCKIGDYVRFHSYDSISENTTIDSFVHFYPFVTTTNCVAPPEETLLPSHYGEFSIIASNSVLLPGVDIGRHCFVAAQSTVKGKVDDFSFMTGNPAKRLMDVRDLPIINPITKQRQYPWPYNFDRGMPWAGIGFEEWLKQNNREL